MEVHKKFESTFWGTANANTIRVIILISYKMEL